MDPSRHPGHFLFALYSRHTTFFSHGDTHPSFLASSSASSKLKPASAPSQKFFHCSSILSTSFLWLWWLVCRRGLCLPLLLMHFFMDGVTVFFCIRRSYRRSCCHRLQAGILLCFLALILLTILLSLLILSTVILHVELPSSSLPCRPSDSMRRSNRRFFFFIRSDLRILLRQSAMAAHANPF